MPYNNTYVVLDTKTVTGSSAASVEFTSIPATYTDLIIVANVQLTSSGQSLLYQFNSDTNTNYSLTILKGNGTSATSDRRANINYQLAAGWDAGLPISTSFATSIINVQNYSNSNAFKTSICRGSNAAGGDVTASVNMWRSTGVITSIKLYAGSGNIAVGSTFSLYGIAATGSNPTAKATGGTITYDANYTYHTFTTSGTFTPSVALTADLLAVAGGGGGGELGGGGGAGGLLYQTGRSLTATGYTVTIGAGGAGAVGYATQAGSGNNSVFSTSTAIGGGGGGQASNNGVNGGSGGGSLTPGTAGTSTQGNSGGATGYGNAGGQGTTTGRGGGGGAGAVGGGGALTYGLYGGNGLSYPDFASATFTGVSGYYAGGGGGSGTVSGGGANIQSQGGLGGGGNGKADASAGDSGIGNTGGGGGGGGHFSGVTYQGGNGGSGVVIIRYASV